MEKPKPKSQPFAYKPRFGVIVICQDERNQAAKYETLKKRGLKLRVVSV